MKKSSGCVICDLAIKTKKKTASQSRAESIRADRGGPESYLLKNLVLRLSPDVQLKETGKEGFRWTNRFWIDFNMVQLDHTWSKPEPIRVFNPWVLVAVGAPAEWH